MNFDLRKMTRSDVDEVVVLLLQVLPDNQDHNEPRRVLGQKQHHDDLMFVAELKAKNNTLSIVGFVMAGFDGHRGWIYSLAVSPDHRRAGIGKALMELALESLKELGCLKVNLQVRTDNDNVVDFYQALGFQVEARISLGKRL